MFGDLFRDKKVVITGHTGFKGSWLTVWLLSLGARVFGISKDIPTTPSMFEKLDLHSAIRDCRADIRVLDDVINIFRDAQPDFIFHLAAQPIVSQSYRNPIETISSNAMGTANVLEAVRLADWNVTAVIITSDKCYDNVEQVWGYKENDTLGGKDIYSGSKGMAELAYRAYFHSFFKNSPNIKSATARAGNVIGGGDWALDRIVPDCMRAWSQQRPVEIRSPRATRPWQHVLEPLSGYLALAAGLYEGRAINGESFNFGPHAEYAHSVENILQDLSRYWKHSRTADAYQVVDTIPFHEAGLLKLNCDKALSHLKWIPTLSYQELIRYTGLWYYEYYSSPDADMYSYTVGQIREYETRALNKGIPWAL